MLHVLIVCTGNTCRSPMAETLLWKKIRQAGMEKQIVVSSSGVGVYDTSGASEKAVTAMARRGLDLRNHQSRQITSQEIADAGLILTMTARHKQAVLSMAPGTASKVFTLTEFADKADSGEVTDPYGKSMADYELCACQMERLLDAAWKKIVVLAGKDNLVAKNDE